MPNGRSGGFIIETADLREFVTAHSDTAVVGRLTAGLQLRAASAAEIARCLDGCPLDRLAVEEHDHTSYIIHIRNEPDIVWVLVDAESPIFAQLRQRHDRWMAEHPGWAGWLAF